MFVLEVHGTLRRAHDNLRYHRAKRYRGVLSFDFSSLSASRLRVEDGPDVRQSRNRRRGQRIHFAHSYTFVQYKFILARYRVSRCSVFIVYTSRLIHNVRWYRYQKRRVARTAYGSLCQRRRPAEMMWKTNITYRVSFKRIRPIDLVDRLFLIYAKDSKKRSAPNGLIHRLLWAKTSSNAPKSPVRQKTLKKCCSKNFSKTIVSSIK